MRPNMGAGMPAPLSSTETFTQASSVVTVTPMRPPSETASMAFLMRLKKTCSSCWASRKTSGTAFGIVRANAISRCAKSLVNGPCGGQKNGKCEVNPENDCAWIMIYKRLEALGQLDKLAKRRADKGYEKVAYPRTINIRGNK